MSENRPWLTLFERESKTADSARFQVACAEVDASDLLQVALVGFGLKTTSEIAQVLFFKCATSSTSLEYAAGQATIYEAALADVRETVAARLADYRRSMVGEITLRAAPLKTVRARPKPRPHVNRTPLARMVHGPSLITRRPRA
jgi:hypothetical protein